MTAHRWLGNDTNPPDSPDDPVNTSESCYACGVTLDATESTENRARMFLPACVPGGVGERAHHYLYIGPNGQDDDSDYLDCAYGDAAIGATDVPSHWAIGPCIGA